MLFKSLILVISFVSFAVVLTSASPTAEVQFEELSQGLQEHTLIYIDVRNRTELTESGKIPGSFVIPAPELRNAFSLSDENFSSEYLFKKPSLDADNVVVGCRSGRRAAKAIELLKEMGYVNFKIYKGSFLDWVAKGGAIVFEN